MWRLGRLGLVWSPSACSAVLVLLALAWMALPSAGAEALEDKLLHANDILDPLEQGQATVKVIVNLARPAPQQAGDGLSGQSASGGHLQLSAAKASIQSALPPADFTLRYRFDGLPAFSVEVTPAGLAQLLNDPQVESIEPVYAYQPLVAEGVGLVGGLKYRSKFDGRGVSVGVIDDGVDYRHPMLGGGSFPNTKVIGGYDFAGHDADPGPQLHDGQYADHGTACAGIVAGSTGGPAPFIGGVAPGAKLYALKVTEVDTDGQVKIFGDAITEAILWCIQHKNDDPANPILAINISIGGPRRYTAPCDSQEAASGVQAVNNAVAAGIAIIQPSGNNGYCDGMVAGACLSNVISVGSVYDADFGQHPAPGYVGCISAESCAGWGPQQGCGCTSGRCYVDQTTGPDVVPSYSNTASFLDLFAPSEKVYTTDVAGPMGFTTGDYRDFGGTSAAAPYVAGAVACLQSAAKAIKGQYLTAAQVRTILTSTGDPVTDHKPTPPITKPRVNLAKAIESLSPDKKTTVVFADTFASRRIDADKWVQYLGATIDDRGLQEPSPDFSLRLNGHPLGNDYVISDVMDLSAYRGATLNYWYQRTGGADAPGSNHDLLFEYDTGAGWRPLSRQSGDGPDMDRYEAVSVPLPAEALSATFRLRIQSFGAATALKILDDWFVDDVEIDAWTEPPQVIVFEDLFTSGELDPSKWAERIGATVDAVGLNEPSPEYSLRLNNQPMVHDSVTSVPLDLSSYARASLSYWYERAGGGLAPGEGEDLIVEYDSGSGWRELNRHRGGEPGMAQYEQVTIELPAQVMTAGFRLRIRSTGFAVSVVPFYDWFVDDIRITAFTGP